MAILSGDTSSLRIAVTAQKARHSSSVVTMPLSATAVPAVSYAAVSLVGAGSSWSVLASADFSLSLMRFATNWWSAFFVARVNC